MEEDELAALRSIYCMPGELEITHDATRGTQIKVYLQTHGQTCAVFNIGGDYPHSSPEVSIFTSDIDRSTIKSLCTDMHLHAKYNTGRPVVIEMISLLQEKLSEIETDNIVETIQKQPTPDISTLLLRIDHMRSRTHYVKTIKRWTEQLDLKGRLLFCQKLILLLLQGNSTALKEYMNRHKSVNIDVDSRGHPCKEKMISVLCDKELHPDSRFAEFRVVEYKSLKSLEDLFTDNDMQDLFLNYVRTLKGIS